MKPRSALLLIVTLALIGAISACTAKGGSIYATIETEQQINVSTLDQTITVLDMIKTASVQFPYLVAAGAVYKGTPPDGNNEIGWPNAGDDPIAVSPPASGALCQALADFDNGVPAESGIFGAFFLDGPGMGLYKSVGAPSYSFKVAAVPAMAGKQVTLLYADAVNLFAVIAALDSNNHFTYALEFSSDGTSFNPAAGPGGPLTGLAKITGVAFLGAPDNTYYVTSGSTLYSGADPNSLAPVANIPNGSHVLEGVTADSATGYILVPSDNGAVYYSDDNGATWTTADTNDDINGRSIEFLTVSTHVDTSAVPGHKYLVGADGAGFYTLNTGNGHLSRFSDVTVTGLYAGSVRRILVDETTVFMGTAGTGLWRAEFDPATGEVNSTWIHE